MTNEERDKLLTTMSATLHQINANMEEFHRAIYGNGHPGLSARMSTLESTTARLEGNESQLFDKCNANKERIVALETSGGGWKQAITWILSAIAVIIAYFKSSK